MNYKKEFFDNGYFLIEDFISQEIIHTILAYLEKMEPTIKVPFSDQAWGYGNLRTDSFINKNIKINAVLDLCQNLTGQDSRINHIICNRKPAFIGPDYEWHREIFNSSTFAPGASLENLRNNWIQIYLPLLDESEANGGLQIVTNSHKIDFLDSEDIVNTNYSHKRRVTRKSMIEATKNGDILPLNLKAGSLLIFSSFLVHASPINLSPVDRLSLVAQAAPSNFIPDEEIYNSEVDFRASFIKESLLKAIDKFSDKERYSSFKKSKD